MTSSPCPTPRAAPDTDTLDPGALDNLRSLETPAKPGIVKQIIALYLSSSPKLLAEIRDAIGTGDAALLRIAAHTLKSSSHNLGATRVGALCLTLENIGRDGSTVGAADLLAELEENFASVARLLTAEIDRAA